MTSKDFKRFILQLHQGFSKMRKKKENRTALFIAIEIASHSKGLQRAVLNSFRAGWECKYITLFEYNCATPIN